VPRNGEYKQKLNTTIVFPIHKTAPSFAFALSGSGKESENPNLDSDADPDHHQNLTTFKLGHI